MKNINSLNFEKIGVKNDIAYVKYDGILITDVSSALDFMSTVRYETDCDKVVLHKENFCSDFFVLSTKIAGEVLQKYINYSMKMAIIDDFSVYTSKPLQDFIRESNEGKDFFFVLTIEDAVDKLQ